MKKACLQCGYIFDIKPSHYNHRKHCSIDCYRLSRKSRIKVAQKLCSLCQKIKPAKFFRQQKKNKTGLASWCNPCADQKAREYRAKNREKHRDTRKLYYQTHKEEIKAKISKEKKAKWDKNYREHHKKELLAKALKKRKIRRKSDAKFLLNERMRSSLYKALKGNKNGRKWESLVGYTLDQLITHLKTNLPAGYVLRDYLKGKMELDHIIPKMAFNYKCAEDLDFKRCWHFTNLRLLPKEENQRKGAHIDGEFQPCLRLKIDKENPRTEIEITPIPSPRALNEW